MEDYTPEQRDIMHRAWAQGWKEMSRRGADSIVFARAFARAGGMQMPGKTTSIDTRNHIATHVYRSLMDGRTSHSEKAQLQPHIHREVNRAMEAAFMFTGAQHPDVTAFRLVMADNIENRKACEEFLSCHPSALGIGIFPKTEPPVLPPCCDRAYWEVVFADELKPAAKNETAWITDSCYNGWLSRFMKLLRLIF